MSERRDRKMRNVSPNGLECSRVVLQQPIRAVEIDLSLSRGARHRPQFFRQKSEKFRREWRDAVTAQTRYRDDVKAGSLVCDRGR